MPIYEFHCEACERDSEILVRSADWRGAKCPHCGSSKLDKKFSTFASAGGVAGAATRAARPAGKKSGGHGCGGGCSCH